MGTPENQWSFSMKSDPCELRRLREELAFFLNKTALPEEDREKIQIVLGEACTNAIRHSYNNEKMHPIELQALDTDSRITFKLRDWGKKIDVSKIKIPKLPPETAGGLGVYFMQSMMDEVCYNTDHEEGNELILVKYKKGAA
jgi:serine/threonine-protein kinase RsbW